MEEAGSTSHRHSLKKHPHSPNLNNLYQRSPELPPQSGSQQDPLQPQPSSQTRDFAGPLQPPQSAMLSRHSSSSRHSHDDPEKEPKPEFHIFGHNDEDAGDVQSPVNPPMTQYTPATQTAQAAQAAIDARRVSFGHRDSSISSTQPARDSRFLPHTPIMFSEPDSRTNGDVQRNPSNIVTDEALQTHQTSKGSPAHNVAELPESALPGKRPPHSSLTWQAAAASNTVSLDPEIASRVALFRALVGITSTDADRNARKRPTAAGLLGRLRRRTLNKGVYKRIIDEEFRATYQHFLAWHVINFALIVQIFLGAAVASLGSFEGHTIRITVVILGALNTAFASALAYMKGQGLPKRLLEYRNALRRAREYCEFREREFELGVDKDLDPQKEARTVAKMYQAARKDEEDNSPDIYINREEQERIKEAGGVGNMPPGTTPPAKNHKKGKI